MELQKFLKITTGVFIGLIIVNIILLIWIFILYYKTKQDLNSCNSEQSNYCPIIQCPCDDVNNDCSGYAKRDNGDGTYSCSITPSYKNKK